MKTAVKAGKDSRKVDVEIIPEDYNDAALLCSANGLQPDEWYWDGENVRLRQKIQMCEINLSLIHI